MASFDSTEQFIDSRTNQLTDSCTDQLGGSRADQLTDSRADQLSEGVHTDMRALLTQIDELLRRWQAAAPVERRKKPKITAPGTPGSIEPHSFHSCSK